MDSVSGTRRGLREVDRWYWHTQLFGYIEQAPSFKTLVPSLAPLWERARQELAAHEVTSRIFPGKDANGWDFHTLYAASRRYTITKGRELPCLIEYPSALDTALCRDLRLVWHGQPAAWAREHLHHAVNPRSFFAGWRSGA